MEINKSLQKFGLEGREARVYLATLKLGRSRVSEIAEAADYERTYCYSILKQLEREGLVRKIEPEGQVATYEAEDPGKLERMAEERLSEIKKIMPEMKSLYSTDESQPRIQYYQGVEGIRAIYNGGYPSKGKVAYGIINPDAAYKLLGDHFDKVIAAGVKQGWKIYDLVMNGETSEKYIRAKRELAGVETRLLPGNAKFQTDFLIFDDRVALISFTEPIHGYIIQSASIAEAWRQIHKVLWELSK